MRSLSLPTLLTLSRVALLPVIALCLYAGMGWIALFLYVLCALSDFADGWLARRMNAITPFGTFLDPVADKIFVAVLLLVLVDVDILNGIWIVTVAVILTREFLVAGMREFLGPKNIQLPVTKLAKWKTAVQMLALGFLLVAPAMPQTLAAGQLLLALAAALTAITGWSYLREGYKHMGS